MLYTLFKFWVFVDLVSLAILFELAAGAPLVSEACEWAQ